MLQFLILTIVLLFASVELFQWIKGVILPLPIYVLAGAFLAITSNYDRGMGSLFNQTTSTENLVQTAVIVEPEPMVLTAESMDSQETSVTIEDNQA